MPGTRKLRTANYPVDARERLGRAVATARDASGHKFRTTFARANNIKSLRSLELLENGDTGVGESILNAVARALPGWTEETPRIILEGGPIPPTAVESAAQAATAVDSESDDLSYLAIADGLPLELLAEFIKVGMKRLPAIRRDYGDQVHDETALKLIKLAQRSGRTIEDLLSDSA